MEGKEVRFGISQSALFATITTDASCGAVNGMHDSFTPLGGMVVLTNIMLGEIVFGGVGSGMYGMLIFVVLAVFIAGLMVGRTPEYLGKKIDAYDVKMSMLYVLIFPFLILVMTAISVLSPQWGLSSLNNAGPHGLSRNPLRLHLRHRQQRIGIRRAECEHALVQHLARFHHVDRAIPDDGTGAGTGRKSRAEEKCSALTGNFPSEFNLVHRAARRRDPDLGCSDFFPGT